MIKNLKDVTGFRGEKIVELCLTDYSTFPQPLFRPGFLGDKWPAIDFYVELTSVVGSRLYFFGQTKATTRNLAAGAQDLAISSNLNDVDRLLQIPAPTYIFGVHEPTKRVFIRAVCASTMRRAITKIPTRYELTPANLQKLHDEVVAHWLVATSKPATSDFI